MTITESKLPGLFIIEPKIFEDERGYFFESFHAEKFNQALDKKIEFVQDNESKSQKGVLRGLHFQQPPYAQGKLVRVIKGAVLDVAVDIRKGSSTYGKHQSIILSEENKKQFYIPEGFAHGFLTLEDNTVFSYKCTNFYNPSAEGCLLWNDKDLAINWNFNNPTLSKKDLIGEKLTGFDSPF